MKVLINKIKIMFKTGFFHIFGSSIINKIIAFLSTTVLVRILTKEEYGVFSYAWNIYSIVILFNGLGMNSALLQLGSEKKDNSDYIGRYAMHAMIEYGVLPFHGVLMEHNGKGIIVCAPSGVGKTTHARLWRDEKNALIINGDNACCYKENDVWKGFGIPWCGTSGESVNRSAEIAAIVILERGAENRVHRLEEYDAFCRLLPLIHYPSWCGKSTSVATELCTDFLKDVPAFRLECKPDAQAVETLLKELEGIYGG